MKGRRGFGWAVALACALTHSASASAETPLERNQARKLAGEALDLFKAGDFAAALGKFSQADALVPAPTLKVRAARCLDKLGRMREAAERYREVISLELKPTSPKVHVEARQEAVSELAKLLEATPRLTVVLAGASTGEATVTIDGKPLVGAVGQEQLYDPGFHSVAVAVGSARVEKAVTLERGASERLVLGLPAAAREPSPPPPPPPAPAASERPSEGNALRTAGWVLTGVGAAGLAFGGVATGLLFADQSKVEAACPDHRCAAEDPDAVALANRFNRERVLSTVGLAAGGVLGAAGLTLVLVAPAAPTAGAVKQTGFLSLAPLLGPAFVGISGRFDGPLR